MGIDLSQPVFFKHASLRFFEKNEHHVTRFCRDNVLLLVYDGVLRFSEDGERREVCAGEYYIQRKSCHQAGELASNAPKYLYVHFDAEWTDAPHALSHTGVFDHASLAVLMNRIDTASHEQALYSELQYLFLKLLLSLRVKPGKTPVAQKLSEYIESNIENISSLSDICREFNYSKNYVIRIFNRELGTSPFQYINDVKIKRAMYLLETTSRPIEEVARECGYADYAYFYKRFVKKTGFSPAKWRKQIQHNPLFE